MGLNLEGIRHLFLDYVENIQDYCEDNISIYNNPTPALLLSGGALLFLARCFCNRRKPISIKNKVWLLLSVASFAFGIYKNTVAAATAFVVIQVASFFFRAPPLTEEEEIISFTKGLFAAIDRVGKGLSKTNLSKDKKRQSLKQTVKKWAEKTHGRTISDEGWKIILEKQKNGQTLTIEEWEKIQDQLQ